MFLCLSICFKLIFVQNFLTSKHRSSIKQDFQIFNYRIFDDKENISLQKLLVYGHLLTKIIFLL